MADTASPDPGKKLFFGLFIFPLLIAVGMAVLLCSVVLMTHEKETPENLIAALKKSSPSKRWQKAFELSNEINRNPEKVQGPVEREMIQVLADAGHYDPKTRSYMAVALGRLGSLESLSALENAIGDPEEEVRVHAMWSLGAAGHKKASKLVEAQLGSDSAETRKTAAYVLGALDASASSAALKAALQDTIADVRWNAALALARLRDPAGYDVLVSMLERDRLEAEMALDEARIESAMINAMKGLALIPRPESIRILESISRQDKNLRVRQASLETLKILRQNSL